MTTDRGTLRWGRRLVAVSLLTLTLSLVPLAAHAEHGEHAEHAYHPHHVAVFLGGTSFTEGWDSYFTAGLDYEFRLPFAHGILGVYAGGEVIVAHGTPIIVTAGLVAHPVAGLKVLAGVGTEFHAEDPEPHFLVRGGVGYDFHLGMFSVGPTFCVDYVNEHVALVYGLSAGMGF